MHREMPNLYKPYKTDHVVKLPEGTFVAIQSGTGVSGYEIEWAYHAPQLGEMSVLRLVDVLRSKSLLVIDTTTLYVFSAGVLEIPFQVTDDRPATWTVRGSSNPLPVTVLDPDSFIVDDRCTSATITER